LEAAAVGGWSESGVLAKRGRERAGLAKAEIKPDLSYRALGIGEEILGALHSARRQVAVRRHAERCLERARNHASNKFSQRRDPHPHHAACNIAPAADARCLLRLVLVRTRRRVNQAGAKRPAQTLGGNFFLRITSFSLSDVALAVDNSGAVNPLEHSCRALPRIALIDGLDRWLGSTTATWPNRPQRSCALDFYCLFPLSQVTEDNRRPDYHGVKHP
jgi:hypothetical protein